MLPPPMAFQTPPKPASPAPGTRSPTAVPTSVLPEPTTWAEYAQARIARNEGVWRNGWARLPCLPAGYECLEDSQDLVRLADSVVRYHRVRRFVRQLWKALSSAWVPVDTPHVLTEWTCCWDCATFVSSQLADKQLASRTTLQAGS